MPAILLLSLSAFVFGVGWVVVLTKQHAIFMLIGIELMLNAANLNLIAFSSFDPLALQGQIFAIFVITVAAAEVAVGLAIVVSVYRYFQTTDLDKFKTLNG